MSREPDLGLHPRTLRSRPEPKALNHLSHPGAPSVTSFKWVHLRYKHANQEWTLAPWMNRLILPSTGIGNIQDEPKASLKKKKDLFILERGREEECMHTSSWVGGRAEGETLQADSWKSAEPTLSSVSQPMRSWPQPKPRVRCLTNRATRHPEPEASWCQKVMKC